MGALLPFVPVGEQTDRSRAQEIVGPYEASVSRVKASRHISRCGVMKQFAVNGEFGRVDCCAPKFLQYGHRKDCSDFGRNLCA